MISRRKSAGQQWFFWVDCSREHRERSKMAVLIVMNPMYTCPTYIRIKGVHQRDIVSVPLPLLLVPWPLASVNIGQSFLAPHSSITISRLQPIDTCMKWQSKHRVHVEYWNRWLWSFVTEFCIHGDDCSADYKCIALNMQNVMCVQLFFCGASHRCFAKAKRDRGPIYEWNTMSEHKVPWT